MFKIGLDLGYGYIKGVNERGKRILFPALVGGAYDRALAGMFGNENGERINNMHLLITEPSGKKEEYFVGELARRESRNISYAFDEDKINHPYTKALIAASCMLLFPEDSLPVHIVTGLPFEQYIHKKDEFKELLKNYKAIVCFQGDSKVKIIKFDKVTIFPQAAGAVYFAIMDELKRHLSKGGYIGLIDVGFKTTDYIVFMIEGNKLVIREDLSGTINIGMSALNIAADKLFTQRTGSKLDIPELINLVKDEKIFFRGKELHFLKELNLIKSEIARVIKDRIKSVWGNKLDFFNTIFLAGGGAKDLEVFISDIHQNSVLTKNYQFANAEGFLKVAELEEKREKKVG